MENYKNLNFSAEQINQKLAWVGDKSKLATTLQETPVNQFMFTKDQKTLKTIIDANNQIITVETNDMITEPGSKLESWNVYVDHLLCINSIACEGTMCSHNYVELGNGSKKDINLNGLYLLYTDCSKGLESDIGYVWQYLPLTGVIKAGSTFVIRGRQTNTIKGSMIKVDSYDMEWDIEFKQNKAAFYLCAGDSFKPLLESNSLGNPWEANLIGYIDSCGFGAEAPAEGNSPLLVNDNWNDIIFVRWFMFETAKQGTKAFAKRKTKDLWTYIDLTKNTTKAGNSIQYYYSDNIKLKYTPKASYLGKDFFTISTLFRQDIPNYVNLTFGRQATDSGSGATRCFNWISVGYYDEYVEIRKQGEEWSKHYSIIEKDSSNTANINKFINYYKRYKWIAPDGTFVTTHKCIIDKLTAGTYEYRIRRDNSNYSSKIYIFKVLGDSEVTTFSYIQTSDQQGFNWQEYQAWKKSSYMISKEQNIEFTINTGDITQNGNRVSEWLDYYDGREYLNNLPEMFTVGNNDLCGKDFSELTDGEVNTSKYNHINVLRYFTFEMDPDNPCQVTWEENTYPIYSTYSFNYGKYHFVSLNSEYAQASSKMYKNKDIDSDKGDITFAQAVNAAIEEWFIKDLKLWKQTEEFPTGCEKCIVYTHDAPFSIVTYDFMNTSTTARAGSKLNTINNNGTYRFSRLFKKMGIRLVMAGHKHTYGISKPIYDAPIEYLEGNKASSAVDILSGEITTDMSRKPVIQVLRQDQVQVNNFARYEVVENITAPTYVTCQATEYKLISNKEQPSGDAYRIPWLLAYFPAATSSSNPKENTAQHKPMYIKYDVSDTNIKITAVQINGIWEVDSSSTKYDFNNQIENLTIDKMTLSTSTEEDLAIYSPDNQNFYTLKLQ